MDLNSTFFNYKLLTPFKSSGMLLRRLAKRYRHFRETISFNAPVPAVHEQLSTSECYWCRKCAQPKRQLLRVSFWTFDPKYVRSMLLTKRRQLFASKNFNFVFFGFPWHWWLLFWFAVCITA